MKGVYIKWVKIAWFKEQNDYSGLEQYKFLKVDFQVYKIPVAPIPPPEWQLKGSGVWCEKSVRSVIDSQVSKWTIDKFLIGIYPSDNFLSGIHPSDKFLSGIILSEGF